MQMNERYKNNKNGNMYVVIHPDITNCTNANDGQKMVLYNKVDDRYGKEPYVRETNEFLQKFTLVK